MQERERQEIEFPGSGRDVTRRRTLTHLQYDRNYQSKKDEQADQAVGNADGLVMISRGHLCMANSALSG